MLSIQLVCYGNRFAFITHLQVFRIVIYLLAVAILFYSPYHRELTVNFCLKYFQTELRVVPINFSGLSTQVDADSVKVLQATGQISEAQM